MPSVRIDQNMITSDALTTARTEEDFAVGVIALGLEDDELAHNGCSAFGARVGLLRARVAQVLAVNAQIRIRPKRNAAHVATQLVRRFFEAVFVVFHGASVVEGVGDLDAAGRAHREGLHARTAEVLALNLVKRTSGSDAAMSTRNARSIIALRMPF